jgi:hypothetical protein
MTVSGAFIVPFEISVLRLAMDLVCCLDQCREECWCRLGLFFPHVGVLQMLLACL